MGSVEKSTGAPAAPTQATSAAADEHSQNAGSAAPGGRGLAGQVPPPFLTKLYDLVDDSETNELVSWSPDGHIFTVHRPTEFEREVLPKYFKHNNFSSFVRQLNQYGFHKQDPDNWTFGQDNFRRGRRDLLVEISRKKSKNQVQVVPGRDGQMGNQKYVLELGNYGVYNEVERLQRDRDVLFNELMMARKQLGLSRKQENQLKQKCDLNERRVEQLENNMKKMQQFLFYYFRPVLKNYGKSKRKRLTAPTTTSGPDMESSSSPGVAVAQADTALTSMMDEVADAATGFTPILTNSGPMAADDVGAPQISPIPQAGTTFPTAVVHELSSDNSAHVDPADWNEHSPFSPDANRALSSSEQNPNGKRRRVAQEAALMRKADSTWSGVVNVPAADEADFPPTGGQDSSSGRMVYHQPTENGFETVFFDGELAGDVSYLIKEFPGFTSSRPPLCPLANATGSAPGEWTKDEGASSEPMMDDLLDIDATDGLSFPPMSALPQGTDIDAFAQRMEDFQESSY